MAYISNELIKGHSNELLMGSKLGEEKSYKTNWYSGNKRNLELSLEDEASSYRSETDNKKVDSPLVKEFFQKSLLSQYEIRLIEFILSENQYYMKLKEISKYYGTLERINEFNTIFTSEQKHFVFADCLKLQEISYKFLKNLLENLIHYLAFKNNVPLKKFNDSDTNHSVLGYNIYQIVLNTDLSKINLGDFINSMFCQEYKVQIILYLLKYPLKVSLLNTVLSSEKIEVKSWLQMVDQVLIQKENNSLTKLISSTVQRLFNYPMQIKALSDSIEKLTEFCKLGLNVSLVKINQVIEKCYSEERLTVIEDAKILQQKLESEFRTKILNDFEEVTIDESNDVKLGTVVKYQVGKNITLPKISASEKNCKISNQVEFQASLVQFCHKYDSLKKLILGYSELNQMVITFMERQISYSNLWVDFLEEPSHNDSRFFNSIYSIYSAKLTEQMNMTRNFIFKFQERVISPLQAALGCCEPTKRAIIQFQKQKDAYKNVVSFEPKSFLSKMSHTKGQSCKEIMLLLRDRVPDTVTLIDSVIDLTFHQYFIEYPRWLYQLLGERSCLEFQELSRSDLPEKNIDIVQFYTQAMDITKIALQGEGFMYPESLLRLFDKI